jgi:murein DD-endopeptidase MepM/ murein hydrolase activator NlpD
MFLYARVLAAVLLAGIGVAAQRPSPPAPPDISVSASARAFQPGELVVLTIRTATPAATVRVRAFDAERLPFAVDPSTWRVLVGIDLAIAPASYKVSIEADANARPTVYPLVVKPRRFPRRTLTVDPAFVTPPPEAVERIEREARELNQIWEASARTRLWDGAFVRPVPDPANSAFGTHSVFNGQPRSQHSGADFRSAAGEPVKAPNAGRVVLADARYFSGNTVVIDHGLGLFSLFAHLSTMDVRADDLVKTGDVIGKVGATGRVTGPHLHWSVRASGARVDPLSLLSVLGGEGTRGLGGSGARGQRLRTRAAAPRSSLPTPRLAGRSGAPCTRPCGRGSSRW